MVTDEELLKISRSLYIDADYIVKSLNLLDIANKYSECHQIGSSVMDLMVDEDIDFTCYTEEVVDISRCFEFARKLITTPGIDKLRIKNYLDKYPYHQFKVYVDPYKYNGWDWQIAFSFQQKTDFLVKVELDQIEWVKSKLTPENKLTILRLKMLTRQEKIKIPGAIIYDAVLANDITDFKDLLEYTAKQGYM